MWTAIFRFLPFNDCQSDKAFSWYEQKSGTVCQNRYSSPEIFSDDALVECVFISADLQASYSVVAGVIPGGFASRFGIF